jgi:hypothetical protein
VHLEVEGFASKEDVEGHRELGCNERSSNTHAETKLVQRALNRGRSNVNICKCK